MAGRVEAPDLRVIAGRGPSPRERRLGRGAYRPGRGPGLSPGRALGRLHHPAPLPSSFWRRSACGRTQFRVTRCAVSSSSTSSGSSARRSRLRGHLLQHRACSEVRVVRKTGASTRLPDYYAESDADVGYATPDAVTLTTVHQAKGVQGVGGAGLEPATPCL